jgi:hypothetical protein
MGKFEARLDFVTTPGLPTNDAIRFRRLAIDDVEPQAAPPAYTRDPPASQSPPEYDSIRASSLVSPVYPPEYSRVSRIPNRRLVSIGKFEMCIKIFHKIYQGEEGIVTPGGGGGARMIEDSAYNNANSA